MGTMRVLLADDQKLVRDGWRLLLDHSSGISVVGQARDGQEAVELAQQLQPDVILMDVNMPRLDGLEATRQIMKRQSRAKILVVSQSLDEALVRTALQRGAWGYLAKSDAFNELVPAILALQTAQYYFGKTIREQYPHLLDAPPARVTVHLHNWQDAAWANLDDRLDRAITEARANRDHARVVFEQSRNLRDESRRAKALTQELVRRRHSDVPPAPL